MSEKVGQQIRDRRNEIGLTQLELAEKIGTQKQHVTQIENGRYNLTLETLEKIAKALKCKLKILFE